MVLSKDDFLFLIAVVALGFLLLLVFFLSVLIINTRLRKQKKIETLKAVIQTQEDERKRISEDLHDEIGPMLSAIKLQINYFSSLSSSPSELKSNVNETSHHLDSVIQNVRTIVRNLSPAHLTQRGLAGTIEDFRYTIEKDGHITFDFVHDENIVPLSEFAQLNIYRIVSELIHNSLKHSNCTHISLSFQNKNNFFLIRYSDDGVSTSANPIKEGMGLKNIRSRTHMLNGKLEQSNTFEQGSSCLISFDKKDIQAS